MRKLSNLKQPTAPPVYRPQPVPRVLQTKNSSSPKAISPPRRSPTAPPVYRPEAKKIVQPKAISPPRKTPPAPPVYRPEQKRVAQPKPALAAVSHRAGIIQASKFAVGAYVSVTGEGPTWYGVVREQLDGAYRIKVGGTTQE